MARDLKEDIFDWMAQWAFFKLMSIRRHDAYVRPFMVLRCKKNDLVDFQSFGSIAFND